MNMCVKTGLDIEVGGRAYRTDAHFIGDCLVFTRCDAQHEFMLAEDYPADLIIRGDHYLRVDDVIIVPAYACTVQSQSLYEQWVKYCPRLVNLVSLNITKR